MKKQIKSIALDESVVESIAHLKGRESFSSFVNNILRDYSVDKDGDSRSRQLARKLNKVQSEIDWLKTKEKEIIHTIKGYEKKEVSR